MAEETHHAEFAPVPPTTEGITTPSAGVSIEGVRKSGKQWKTAKQAFRPGKNVSKGWDERQAERKAREAMRARERELKAEKESERLARVQHLKEKREKKEEQERFAKLAEKMHVKRVERLRRREKRNRALKER